MLCRPVEDWKCARLTSELDGLYTWNVQTVSLNKLGGGGFFLPSVSVSKTYAYSQSIEHFVWARYLERSARLTWRRSCLQCKALWHSSPRGTCVLFSHVCKYDEKFTLHPFFFFLLRKLTSIRHGVLFPPARATPSLPHPLCKYLAPTSLTPIHRPCTVASFSYDSPAFCPQCFCMFHMVLTINSDFFRKRH
jgi:hypothetical protein